MSASMQPAQLSVTELRLRFIDAGEPLPESIESALAADRRAGAQAVYKAVLRRRSQNRSEAQRLRKLLTFERELWEAGILHVAGVDEAGMAPLAGPVVAAAAILPRDCRLRGVDDSKVLDAETRTALAIEIKACAISWAVGHAEVEEIDRINIYHAGLLAMRRAVEGLGVVPHHVLVDARRIPGIPMPQRGIIKGDALSLSITAASIIAKTTRDALMARMDDQYPGYAFTAHKGYPTPVHFEALRTLGPCAIHRRSFAPVRAALGLDSTPAEQGELF